MASPTFVRETPAAAATALREHGVAVLRCVAPAAAVDACRAAAAAGLAACDAAVAARLRDLDVSAPDAHHVAARCHRGDFAEFLRRDGGRVDLRVGVAAAPFDALLLAPDVLEAAREATGGAVVIL